MTLQKHIEDIRNKLKSGAIKSETAVFEDIVIPLLGTLNWTIDTKLVEPAEFGLLGQAFIPRLLSGRDVLTEFALVPPSFEDAMVYFKLVAVGKMYKAERELRENPPKIDVPIVVLTAGKKWRFFYPGGKRNYRERRVRKLNLVKGDTEENAKYLKKYLNYDAVINGDAGNAIKADYREFVTPRHLRKAWKNLLKKREDFSLNAMTEEMKHLGGYTPTKEELFDFFDSVKIPKEESTHLIVTMPDGKEIQRKNASDTFREVIEKLGIEDVRALGIKECKIPLVSTSKHATYRQKKSGKYYIITNNDTDKKEELLEEIADKLDFQLEVEVVPK